MVSVLQQNGLNGPNAQPRAALVSNRAPDNLRIAWEGKSVHTSSPVGTSHCVSLQIRYPCVLRRA